MGSLGEEEEEGRGNISCASVSPEWHGSCSASRSDLQDPWESNVIG